MITPEQFDAAWRLAQKAASADKIPDDKRTWNERLKPKLLEALNNAIKEDEDAHAQN
jgi:hypothetical protein